MLKSVRYLLLCLLAALMVAGCVEQRDWVRRAGQAMEGQPAALSEGEIIRGLKEALRVGTGRAVALLGREGGYLGDLSVRIPVPDTLHRVEQVMRDLGQGRYVDEFITSLNRAAEQAAPQAVDIFVSALRDMTLEDARAILQGSDDAATRYFRTHTEPRLAQAMLPVVRTATARVGVTRSYKDMVGRAGPLGQLVDREALDIDGYITRKALDGLFLKLAAEERLIRNDPVARSTELLRKVFGSRS